MHHAVSIRWAIVRTLGSLALGLLFIPYELALHPRGVSPPPPVDDAASAAALARQTALAARLRPAALARARQRAQA